MDTVSAAPTRLSVEFVDHPIGIDVGVPRMSWWSGDDRQAEVQSGYQIQAASTHEALFGEPDLWDTGRVVSSDRVAVAYGGTLPAVGSPAFWRVRAFDSDGLPSAWSEVATFELWQPMGRARWVAAPLAGSRSRGLPVCVFRRGFELDEAPVRARLAISALGVIAVRINGELVGGLTLTPGWTAFAEQVSARLVDVGGMLKSGQNEIEVLLGDGWYAGAVDGITREHYGRQTRFAAELHCVDKQGGVVSVFTDTDWRWQATGILASDVVLGESIDARHAELGVQSWQPVQEVGVPTGAIAGLAATPLVPMERVSVAPLLRQMAPGAHGLRRWRADLGAAMLGQVSVTLNAAAGSYLAVRYACHMDEHGEPVFVGGDDYTARGGVEEVFAPLFSLHGARWLEFEGDVAADAIADVHFQQVGANLLPVSGLETDHSFINRYFDYCRRSIDNVLLDVPLAGIDRHRRHGQVAALLPLLSAVPHAYDAAAWLQRWVRAMCAEHTSRDVPLSVFPPVRAPVAQGTPLNAQPPSAETNVIGVLVFARAVWTLYRVYGDRRVVDEAFPVLRRFLHHLQNTQAGLICTRSGADFDGSVPEDLVATALFYESTRLATRMSGVLGRLGEMESFDGLAQRIRSAFRRRFVTPDGAVVGDTATACVLTLDLDLLEGGERTLAMARLERHIVAARYHRCVHPLLADRLLDVVGREARLDLAYALLLQTSKPSWLGGLVAGERAGTDALGVSALAFLFRHVAGIQEHPELSEEGIAYRHVVIAPKAPFGAQFPEGAPLAHVAAHYDSAHGRYDVSWELETERFTLRVVVPCGCEAKVQMPDGAEHRVAAGTHVFSTSLLEDDDGIPVLQDSLGN